MCLFKRHSGLGRNLTLLIKGMWSLVVGLKLRDSMFRTLCSLGLFCLFWLDHTGGAHDLLSSALRDHLWW